MSFSGIFKNGRQKKSISRLFDDSTYIKEEHVELRKEDRVKSPAESEREKSEKEEDKNDRTVFVGNLPLSTKKLSRKLKRYFSKCEFDSAGDVESVRLRSVPSAQGDSAPKRVIAQNRRFDQDATCNAYIVFKNCSAVQSALQLNLATVPSDLAFLATCLQFEGNRIRVDCAGRSSFKTKRKDTSNKGNFLPKTSVVVKNLDKKVDDQDLFDLFNDGQLIPLCKDSVRNWRIVKDHRTGESKGYGFVSFSKPTEAKAALTLDGHRVQNSEIRVEALLPVPKPRGKRAREWGGMQTKGRFKLKRKSAAN